MVYALGVTQHHSCVLAMRAPRDKDQLFRYLASDMGLLQEAGGASSSSQLVRGVSGASLARQGSDRLQPQDGARQGAAGQDEGGIPCSPPDPGDMDAQMYSTLTGGELSPRGQSSFARYALPAPAASSSSSLGRCSGLFGGVVGRCLHPAKDADDGDAQEVVLLKRLVQPGVASKRAFTSLSTADLLSMARTASETNEWRELGRLLEEVLRCPSVLNASFHFPGLRRPRLDAEALREALDLTSAAGAAFQDGVLDAASAGLDEYGAPVQTGVLRTAEQFRGALAYLLLPQVRSPEVPRGARHRVMGGVSLLVTSLAPAERREVMELFVNEVPLRVMRQVVVPAVLLFLNERAAQLSNTTPVPDDPAMWRGLLLLQGLFLANERMRLQQNELKMQDASSIGLETLFMRPSEFQVAALDGETHVLPLEAFRQLAKAFGTDLAGAKLPDPEEIFFAEWKVENGFPVLPDELRAFMVHRNLVPTSFKQKVLQVSNSIRQQTFQHAQGQNDPTQILLAMLNGRDPRPFMTLKVRRTHIVEDTVRGLQGKSEGDLRLPLKVAFEGEDGVDEGGVRREFFQVLMRQLFDDSFGMFENGADNTTWFNKAALDDEDTNSMFRICGMVVGLAVYNNQDGIQIHLPLALFKKLKGEAVQFADLESVDPEVWLSLQKLLAWSPSTQKPNQEFEDTFCLNFSTSADFFGDVRTFELKPDGKDIGVDLDHRQEYVDLYVRWLLETSVERQFRWLQEGFKEVVDSGLWSLLSAEEARLMVCGEPDLDMADLRRGVVYEGYHDTEPYMDHLWQVLDSFDLPQRKRFMVFVTGSDRAPLAGLRALHMKIQKLGEEPTDRLPVSHTCFNLLQLPRYSDKEKLEAKLLAAIEYAEGFGLE